MKPAQSSDVVVGLNIAFRIFLCNAYIVVSALLINYNKFLIKRFPYPFELTAMHMLCCSFMSIFFYTVAPGLFPAMERIQGRELELIRYFLPLGAFFSVALYASNTAYIYCSVAFLQFMKESNVVLMFLLCCAIGMQKMDRVKAAVVIWISIGSWMCVHGEMRFSAIGFAAQALSQVAECLKNVLGEYIMSGTNFKLDPLSFTMFMSPVALGFLTIGIFCTWDPLVIQSAKENWHYLLPNAFLAYLLNLTIATVLKNCSAMGFVLAGVVKDIVIVYVSARLFGDVISTMQYISFAITLGGCVAWSMLKMSPDGFVARSLRTLTCAPEEARQEKLPILAQDRDAKKSSA